MPDAPFGRLAVIGLGMATKPHLEALAELRGRVEVSGVFNRSPEKAHAVAETYGFPVFDSLEAIAVDPATDGVILATPPNARAGIVAMMADAKKAILMEKPVERTLAAAVDLVETCERAGVPLGIVFQHRFRPGARRLRALLDEGALGSLALIRVEVPWWRGQGYYDEPGRGTRARDGGGVLISQAIHVLDLMLSVTGPVAQVQAMCATTRLHEMETEDFVAAGLTFADGAFGSLVATTATWPGAEESLVLDGTLGTAVLRGGRLDVAWRDGRKETVGEAGGSGSGADPMAFPCDWHRDLIEDFVRSVAEGRAPAITGREALRVHALIDALVRSGAEERSVAMEPMG